MKRFYFLQYNGRVFALDPRSRSLWEAVQIEQGEAQAVQTTRTALKLPLGRRHCRRAGAAQVAYLRKLIQESINEGVTEKESVAAYTTPLPAPLVAFLAQQPWTEQDQINWETKQRAKNTAKKKLQRERKRNKTNGK